MDACVRETSAGSESVIEPSASSVTVIWFVVPATHEVRSVEVARPADVVVRSRAGVLYVSPRPDVEVA